MRAMNLKRAALDAEWDVPEGRIGGLVRQQRYRAGKSLRRANWLFAMLCVVIFFGLGFYLGLPFWRQYVDGQKGTLYATLDTIKVQTDALDARRREIISTDAPGGGLVENLALSIEQVRGSGDRRARGMFRVGAGVYVYGAEGLLLRSEDGGKSFAPFGEPREASWFSKLTSGTTTLLVADDGTILRLRPGVEPEFSEIALQDERTLQRVTGVQDRIFAYDDEGGFFLSRDGGRIFEPVALPEPRAIRASDTLADAVLLDTGADVFRVDLEGNVTRAEIFDPRSAQERAADRKVSEEVFRSLRGIPRSIRSRSRIVAVSETRVFRYSGEGVVHLSTDGGARFSRLVGLDRYMLSRHYIHSETGRLFLFGADALILAWNETQARFDAIVEGVPLDEVIPALADGANGGSLFGITRLMGSPFFSGLLSPNYLSNAHGDEVLFISSGRSNIQTVSFNVATDKVRTLELPFTGRPTATARLNNGDVLILGSDGLLARWPAGAEQIERIPLEDTSTRFLRLFQDADEMVIFGSGPHVFTAEPEAQSFELTRVPGEPALIAHLETEDARLFLSEEGAIFRMSGDLLAQAKAKLTADGPLTDEAVIAFIDDVLPRHIRAENFAASARARLTDIKSQRQVVDDLRAETNARLERLLGFPNSVLIQDRAREEFGTFMALCRGPAPTATQDVSSDEAQDPPRADAITLACLEGWQAQRASEEQQWWQSIAQQVPPGVLLLFLLATLGGLYRYNMRMVGFH
ncbi:MAG: hypothetical protein AAF744_11880, partial [Pseudomonadota bacterium]